MAEILNYNKAVKEYKALWCHFPKVNNSCIFRIQGGNTVITTPVVSIHIVNRGNGFVQFETKNTIYRIRTDNFLK